METMEISNTNNQFSTPIFGGTKRADIAQQVAPKAASASKDSVIAQQRVTDTSKTEKERLETVLKGAENFKKNFYPLGDSSFTIYKTTDGQFVTRFTNKQDNTVTYLPEVDVARYTESKANMRAAIFELEA